MNQQQTQSRQQIPTNNSNNNLKPEPRTLVKQNSFTVNILDWEKQVGLNEKEESIFKQLENIETRAANQKQIIQKPKKSNKQNNESRFKLNFQIKTQQEKQTEIKSNTQNQNQEQQKHKDQEQQRSEKQQLENQLENNNSNNEIFRQIKQIKVQNSKFLVFLNEILSNLQDIQQQFADLQSNKAQLIQKISAFYDKSQKIIDEQKSFIELQSLLKENIQYYTQAEDIQHELDQISFDMNQRNSFENIFQRFLSEINDGIVFFEANVNFTDAKEYYAGLEANFQTLDIAKNFRQYFSLTLKKCAQQDQYYKELKNLSSKSLTLEVMEHMFVNFAEKIRQDCMHKLIQQAQVYIQDNISSFDMNQYLKKKQLVIREAQKDEEGQQQEYFPIVLNAVQALSLLQNRIEKSIFQNMACDIVSTTMGFLFQVAGKYSEKFDAFLFLAKNLILLSEHIIQLNMDFLVKEKELDFSETKSLLKDVIAGNIQYNFNFTDLVQADKLWNYASSFFNFLYRGMPKLNEFTIDLKKDIVHQIRNVFNNMNKDITFIISKTLIDFIRKYQQLSELEKKLLKQKEKILNPDLDDEDDENNENEYIEDIDTDSKIQQLSSEDKQKMAFLDSEIKKVQEDLELMFQRDIVKKTYVLFLENLKEMSVIIVQKLRNFVDEDLFNKLIHHIYEIQQNSIELLSNFYIIISKKYRQQEYEQFQFISQTDLRRELREAIGLPEDKN